MTTGNNITDDANSHQPLLGPTGSSSLSRPNSVLEDFRTLLCSAYINVLLLFLPFALISGALEWSARTVFLTNLFALMPLASLLSVATDVLSESAGNAVGCLLNVTFGNATELIVGIVSLRKRQVKLIQTTMLGSILSSLLFILGLTFTIAGTRTTEFEFDSMIAQTLSSFMFVATGALILPAAFDSALPDNHQAQSGVLALSRGTSIILLILYILFLFFQLKTHASVFNSEDAGTETAREGQQKIVLSPLFSAAALLVVTVAVSFCSDYLVGSIDDVVQDFGISKTFIGLILVPVVGNAAAIVTCANQGYKLNMNLVVSLTLGSCMQIALFLTPFLVVVGWCMDVPMTLNFEIFQAVVIFVSVIFTEYLIMDGSSNWMEGSMLLGVYSIVAISYWLYPDIDVKT